MTQVDQPSAWRDIRGVGFAARSRLAEVRSWLDSVPSVPAHEMIPLSRAVGRVLASDLAATRNLPPVPSAAIDGFAVHAADSAGAGIYNPCALIVSESPGAGRAVPVTAGATLPLGTDTVLAFTAVSRVAPDQLQVITEAAPGEGVTASGRALRAGAIALSAGHVLRPQDVALLAMLGNENAHVISRPKIRLVVAGPKAGRAEALEAMLAALIERDGGEASGGVSVSLASAIAAPTAAEVTLIAGRSGPGADDVAAPAVKEAGGEVVMHGVAMRPGGSSGLARLHGKAALLLPGEPLACLTAYDMLAARLIRRLARISAILPYPRTSLRLGRKIVSAIGFTDIVPVAKAGEAVVPTISAECAELPSACQASGFVVVPEALEGYREGESVSVCLYDTFPRDLYCCP